MQVIRIQKVTKKSKLKKQELRDRKQNNRLFNRSFQGGLSRKLIREHEEATNAKRMV